MEILILLALGAAGVALYRSRIDVAVPGVQAPNAAPEPTRPNVVITYEDDYSYGSGATYTAEDVDYMARTLWGEARGEDDAGMKAVAWVIRNRRDSGRFPSSIKGVVTQAWQFSTWNATDPNRAKMLAVTESDSQFRRAQSIAQLVLSGATPDPTGGAVHYANESIIPSSSAAWEWIQTAETRQKIGQHTFYTGVA
ncbi:cell wall hydrolase [Parvularcula sp. LCG005]|uniref:cell wall hydrolase n=1 Tax=Parvularcula sp. LCG005 TaxID=3078805 RepID=UPI0029430B82|nr:cell wall hydrolase [Parvularcula sp. LCG005]WOI51976.1 cell wall hydrolase [Parvularcula sp. LCG005]